MQKGGGWASGSGRPVCLSKVVRVVCSNGLHREGNLDISNKDKGGSLNDIIASLRKGFLQVGFFSLFVNLMMLIPPLYMLQVYDRVLTSRSQETLLLLTLLLGWMFLTMGVLEFVRSRMMVRLSSRLDALLNRRLYRSVMRLALSQPGEVGSRPLEDLSSIRQFISSSGVFAFFDAPWIPIYLAILFLFDSLFGLLALFAATLLGVFAIINELSTRGLQRQSAEGQIAAMKPLMPRCEMPRWSARWVWNCLAGALVFCPRRINQGAVQGCGSCRGLGQPE